MGSFKRSGRFLGGLVLVVALLVPLYPITARADMGPKPSVEVEFTGLEDETYYVTLLSEEAVSGPWNREKGYEEWYGEREIWDKFREYGSASGLFFLGYFEECSGTDLFYWNYHPPELFKILLYFPRTDTFLESEGFCERYAFDSYFAAEYAGAALDGAEGSGNAASEAGEEIAASGKLTVRKSYDYGREIRGMIFRVLLTLVIELLVAWFFGFRSWKAFFVILLANLATQTALNLALNTLLYYNGPREYVLHYAWMELAVFCLEGALYNVFFKGKQKVSPWLYAFVANLVSLVAGALLSLAVPGIF